MAAVGPGAMILAGKLDVAILSPDELWPLLRRKLGSLRLRF
jgi:hypothetical protein